ncbi:hypothetical protein TNCT_244911 [Trichonephila clavata]|uniref:Uncharacterized protein n=1 Tax=Trichonephila clavata TaxID=2740835 RepID=A0A8X6G6E5_TRICU|nr:hypothetical protein TNCT_244911 [Trichonephila clavata]
MARDREGDAWKMVGEKIYEVQKEEEYITDFNSALDWNDPFISEVVLQRSWRTDISIVFDSDKLIGDCFILNARLIDVVKLLDVFVLGSKNSTSTQPIEILEIRLNVRKYSFNQFFFRCRQIAEVMRRGNLP